MSKRFLSYGKVLAFALYTALAVTAVSCSKKEETTGEESGVIVPGEIVKMQFAASFADTFVESKAALNDLKPVWQEGDGISLFDPEGVARDLTLKSMDGGSAVFEGDAEMSGPYAAVYPRFAEAAYEGGKIIAEIPATQVFGGPGIAKDALVSVAYTQKASSAGKAELDFRNVCSIINFALGDNITAVTLLSNDGSPIAGKVSIDPASGAATVIDGTDRITLKPSGETFPSGIHYACVLPGEYECLKLIYSFKGELRKGEWEAEGQVSLEKNMAYKLGEIIETQHNYYIGNADELMAWIGDKANWNPEGETVYITGDIDLKDAEWTPLSDSYPGVIEGNGHKISHFHISGTSTEKYRGFFNVKYAKTVRNLIFGSVDGKTYDGSSYIKLGYTSATDAWVYAGIFTYVSADIIGVTSFVPVTVTSSCNTKTRAGGIGCWIEKNDITIEDCHNYGTVTLENFTATSKTLPTAGILGGIGEGATVLIRNCVNHGDVIAKNINCRAIGGIVGFSYAAHDRISLEDCVNEGEVKMLYSATHGTYFCIGGIMGQALSTAGVNPVFITSCTNRGKVYSEAMHQHYVGGILGQAEGAQVMLCTNEGDVEIDHTAHATTRFQYIGGIVGGTKSGGDDNIIRNNTNKGNVSMKVASSGHNATPGSSSDTGFYGVNAGGILGFSGDTNILADNINEGSVIAENAFSASNASYPSIVHAGGILGYDMGPVGNFAGNVFKGYVEANTTTSTSVPSQAYAGGQVGHLMLSTILSGSCSGTVKASVADAGSSVYAGSIAGYNDATIASCSFGGSVNGVQASETNTVGGGAAPINTSDNPGGGGGVFATSTTEINFPGSGFSTSLLTVTTGEEAVDVTKQNLDWLDGNIPESIDAGASTFITLKPLTANVYDNRSGVLVFKEKTSGKEIKVNVTQNNLYTPVNGYPCRWEIKKDATYASGTVANEAGRKWINEGVAVSTVVATSNGPSAGAGTGYIHAVPVPGNTLKYSIDISSTTKTLGIGNLGEGDCIHFSVPVVSLPAGTPVDLMLTMNTNNNASPKYWLFEYWDGSSWKQDDGHLFTAKEDGKTKYSFYVYRFASDGNHRTFIGSCTLPQAISNDFIKLRIRAVGDINCNGTKLVRTPGALMYIVAYTYEGCEINAYPDAPAVKDVTRLMQFGNSQTFYYGSAFYLKQLSRAEGHQTDVRINVKGSQQFEHHLKLQFSTEIMQEGNWDKAILQDGSYYHAVYGKGENTIVGRESSIQPDAIFDLTKQITAEFHKYSPSGDVVLESCYSVRNKDGNYLGFESFPLFDYYMWKGSTSLAHQIHDINWLSPIGMAFAIARNKYGFDAAYNYLNYSDSYHPNRYGAYLKACVDYLILFGEPFGAHPADCDIPAEQAAKLRNAAQDAVFGFERNTGNRERFHYVNGVSVAPEVVVNPEGPDNS